MAQTARRALVAALVFVAVVAVALALWELRVLVSLLVLGIVIAEAMRPGVDRLAARRVPPAVGIAIHYLVLAGALALLVWFVVPRAIDQVETALGGSVPTSPQELERAAGEAARESTGTKREVLVAIREQLDRLPTAEGVIELTRTAFEAVVGIFFVLATAAYWIFERDRAVDWVTSLLPRPKRRKVRATWELVDAKLGAFVRGELLLVVLVAAVLSVCFWAIGLPYWLLIAIFAGVVELIPVIGPLVAGAVAIAVGFTVSWQTALLAGIVVFVVRMLEDYIVIPRVLGHAVGLSPLTVLLAVTSFGLVLGGAYVLLAIPLVAALVTVLDVTLRDVDPEDEEVPTVLFPAQDRETVA